MALIVSDGLVARLASRDAGPDTFVYLDFAESVRIITAISEEPFSIRQTAQQGRGTGIVAHLTGRDKERDRAAAGVRDGMQPGVHTTLCLPDYASNPPFFNPRLEAVRCALRQVASIEIV